MVITNRGKRVPPDRTVKIIQLLIARKNTANDRDFWEIVLANNLIVYNKIFPSLPFMNLYSGDVSFRANEIVKQGNFLLTSDE